MFAMKMAAWLTIGAVALGAWAYSSQSEGAVEDRAALAARQLDPDADGRQVGRQVRMDVFYWDFRVLAGLAGWLGLGALLFAEDARRLRRTLAVTAGVALASGCSGYPIVETVEPSEEAFLIPYTENDRQSATNSEEALRKNLVQSKLVLIPQRYIYSDSGTGYRPTAKLIKVDRAPVTREWTADANSGTSERNEAIWVMTSDQVECSTGWTITAYIAGRDDAVKFLYYYPAGSLEKVLDQEVRAKLQAEFGIEVTDLPMEEIRTHATPHIQATIRRVRDFFSNRGISITNLGITGGFVYKDPKIREMMSRVFQSEQEAAIAKAETRAQEERNKRIHLAAESKARAVVTEKEGEAKGVRAVADAKAYEIEKAQANKEAYLALKRIELEQKKLERWDGRFPTQFFGGGAGGPEMLLGIPAIATAPTPK